MRYSFDNTTLNDFSANIHKEWVLTNGIGGYAGCSIIGACNRTHQGYLIACFKPPVSRYLVFSKTNEAVIRKENTYDFTTAQHKGQLFTEGQRYLKGFSYDGSICYSYEAKDIILNKSISLAQGQNLSAIAYEVINKGEAATFTITPLINYRNHNDNVTASDLVFNEERLSNGIRFIPQTAPEIAIDLLISEGEFIARENKFDVNMELQTEVDNEVDGLDTHYTPYDIKITIPANSTKHISLICQAQNILDKNALNNIEEISLTKETAFEYKTAAIAYTNSLINEAGYTDEFANNLVVAANQFLCYRKSTGYQTVLAGLPWFTDWGRDTMIAYTGLTLSTKQFDAARDILLTFAMYEKNGMIPNMFPDDGQEPLYNTADASLWYFYAVYKYLQYVNTPEAYDFIKEKIYPVLKNIIKYHKSGTEFSIYMDKDYLMHAGSGIDQVTWMDVRVGDWVPTPRHGKPVEINALWYNALKVMEFLSEKYGEDSYEYTELANNVKTSFNAKFWNEKDKCLYDVVGDEGPDSTIRPNQIYALSLPFTMLSPEKEASIVNVVKDKLYVGVGLRSLDPSHKDYHPIYLGSLPKRDAAYHQGTAWGFLLGGFITAYVKVNGKNPETAKKALELIAPVKEHLLENCIGSICEIFDGDAPHFGRGCYAQAWSVGEVLRCYTEDILPFLS